MDKSLLRKVAIQCLALMITVVTFSYARSQYQPVTIEAIGQVKDNASVTEDSIITTNHEVEDIVAKLTPVQEIVKGVDQSILSKLGENYMVIKKPQGNHLSLQLEDLYINKSIQITISGIADGDFTSNMISRIRGDEIFAGNPEFTETTTLQVDKEEGTSKEVITRDYGKDIIHGITIKSSQDDKTMQYESKALIELDTVYAYIIYEDANFYFIDLRKPSEVYDKILVLDAGHGGKDGGALSKDDIYFEKNINLEILLELKKLMDKEDIKVYYTRTDDNTVYLRPRVELANAVDCDYFISIHCNANNVSSPNGSEVLYYNNKFKGVKAIDLAKLFSKELGKTVALENKGIVERHYEDIFIMDKAIVPMILIEVGYLSNNNDMYYLSKDSNRKAVAKGIYNGILKAYKELPVNK